MTNKRIIKFLKDAKKHVLKKKVKKEKKIDFKKKYGIPKPDNKYGYTYIYMTTFLTEKEMDSFVKWIRHQTCMRDDKTGETVFFTYDVARFIGIARRGGNDFWD